VLAYVIAKMLGIVFDTHCIFLVLEAVTQPNIRGLRPEPLIRAACAWAYSAGR